jgi:hypothetical protein
MFRTSCIFNGDKDQYEITLRIEGQEKGIVAAYSPKDYDSEEEGLAKLVYFLANAAEHLANSKEETNG